MPSTFTANLGLEKVAPREGSGRWGAALNVNFDSLDACLNGRLQVDLTGLSSFVLQTLDGSRSDGDFKFLRFFGATTGAFTVSVAPNNQEKWFYVANNTPNNLVFTQGSGGDATVRANTTAIIVCDGAGATASVLNVSNDISLGAFTNISGGSISGVTLSSSDIVLTGGSVTGVTLASSDIVLTGGSVTGVTLTSSDIVITGGSITGITPLAIADGGTGSTNAANARTALGLVIGTDVQAFDANLQSFVNAFTVPVTDGSQDQRLRTNGSGVLSFAGPALFRPTSTEAVDAGDVVALNSDGTVSKVTTLAANADEWLGIAGETVLSAGPVFIQTKGGVSPNLSGLTAGEVYYLADDGTLTTTTTGGRKVGKALSATRLLITEGNV